MLFEYYAKFYNLLYKDKDYKSEVDHINSLIRRFEKKGAKSILDIGCGTGTHAGFMAQLGYQVTGIDLSTEMVNQAKAKFIPNAEFHVGNAASFSLNEEFDVVTSLFHVLSYQTSNESVVKMVKNAAAHLIEGGLFIFDFWYGPAVLNEKPSVRIKRLEDDDISVTRIAEPVLKVNENVVDVNFELNVIEKSNNQVHKDKEMHPMRYFFKPEIDLLLETAGMSLLYFNEWMTERVPSEQTWGVCCVAARKKSQLS